MRAHASGLLIALLICAGCQSPRAKSPTEELEGWRTENGEDVFYLRLPGRASPGAIEEGNEISIKSTCVSSTKIQAENSVIEKMIGRTVQGQSGTLDAQTTDAIITSVSRGLLRGTSIKECVATDERKIFKECECVHFVRGIGLKKKFELSVEQTISKGHPLPLKFSPVGRIISMDGTLAVIIADAGKQLIAGQELVVMSENSVIGRLTVMIVSSNQAKVQVMENHGLAKDMIVGVMEPERQ